MTQHHETSANYKRVLFTLGRYRVAVCKDDLQWLFQQRVTVKTCAGARWRNLGYCTTRNALLRFQHKFLGVSSPEIGALPETFNAGGWN